MTRTEADLRDALGSHAADPDAHARLAAFAAGLDNPQPRRLRPWLVPIAAAVAVLIPIATVLAIRSGQQHNSAASPSVVAGPTATPVTTTVGPPETTDPSALLATPWELTDYIPATGTALHESAAAGATVVRFSQSRWSYSGFCNTGGGGPVTVGDGTLDVGQTGYTSQAACLGSLQQGLSRIEGVNSTWQIRGNTLTITLPDGSRLLLSATAAQPIGTPSSASTAPLGICDGSDLSVSVQTLPVTGEPKSINVSLTNRSAASCSLGGKYPVTILAGRLDGTPAAPDEVLAPTETYTQPFAITGDACGNGGAVPGQDLKSWSVTAQGEIFRPPVSSTYVNFFVSCAVIVPRAASYTLTVTSAPTLSAPVTSAPVTSAPPTTSALRVTSTPPTTSAAAPSEKSLATITGRFTQVGGPPRSDGSTPTFDIAGVISAYTNSAGTGTPVATTTSDSAGNFTLRLQPGTYYLYGTNPNSRQEPGNIPSRVAATNPVVARPGSTTTADITAEVP